MFLKHIHNGFNRDNSLVRFVFQNSMYTDSRIQQNIRYLAYKCGFNIQNLIKLTCSDIINILNDEWKARVKEKM